MMYRIVSGSNIRETLISMSMTARGMVGILILIWLLGFSIWKSWRWIRRWE